MINQNKRKIYILFMLVAALSLALVGITSPSGNMLAAAEKKGTDILFLKGKFILKDKKGSIVISDEKKCHCPHYFK